MLGHPRLERIAITGGGVPRRIEGIVAPVVPIGIRGIGAVRHRDDGADRPRGQYDADTAVELLFLTVRLMSTPSVQLALAGADSTTDIRPLSSPWM